MSNTVIGIIGGSGIYDLEGLEQKKWQKVSSPFGEPSDEVLCGTLGGVDLVFLPRHGRGHKLSPSEINYRANIDILKRLNVSQIISVSACGSLDENLTPGTFVLVDQFIDRTFAREKSFFTSGMVAHVSMADPVCSRLLDQLEIAGKTCNIDVVRGGTYLAMEGPQFSSRAESQMYRGWGCQVIGMTNMPEAKLAREAEICYATVAMVTDFDCWHPDHDNVDVAAVIQVLMSNSAKAKSLVGQVATMLDLDEKPCSAGCHHALENALITAPEARDKELLAKLDAVAGRVL